MIETTALVPAENASEFVMGLCNRLDDGLPIDFRQPQGIVRFDDAVATLTPRDDQLVVTILANDGPSIERLQRVLTKHLVRFLPLQTPVEFDWSRSSSLELHAL